MYYKRTAMNYKIFIYVLAVAMVIFTGCHKDVFDSEALGRDYFIENIPEGFDWTSSSSIQVEITPSDNYAGTYLYTIDFFDKNPIADSSANLLGSGWCSGKQPLKKSIIISDAQADLFVCQTTPGGRRSVMQVPIENNRVICNFSRAIDNVAQNRTLSLLANSDEFEIPEIPADVIEITGKNNRLESGRNYIIRGEYTGELNFNNEKNISLYVTGIWNNTAKSTKLEVNTNIYVINNGKIFSREEWDIQVYSNSNLAIAKGCQFGDKDHDDISIRLNSGIFLNEGLVYMEDIYTDQSNTLIKNSGEFHLDKLEATTAITINNADGGKLYIEELEIGNATFINQCYAEIEEMELNYGSSLTIASGCAVKCEKLNVNGAKITLASNSLLEVTDEAEFKGAASSIGRTGSDFALFKTRKIKSNEYWQFLTFSGQLYVEWEKIESKSQFYKFIPPAQLVDSKKGSLIDIPASECSQGNDYQPEEPEEPEFPRQVTLTKSYTFASEDLYPSPGDFDMNDIVLGMDSVTYNYVEKDRISYMIWHCTLRAVGATRQSGAAIQLDGLKDENIQKVTYSKELSLGNFNINSNGTESKQTYAVVPLFDNAHRTLGCDNTSTILNAISKSPQWINDVPFNSFDVKIECTSPVEELAIRIDNMNYFAIIGTKTPRTEIHLPHYNHTDLSNAPKVLQEVTKDYMWTIRVPGIFRYSHEWTSILEAYPEFKPWVQSGGNSNKEWYNNPIEENLYRKK